jgi:hypothetical protein
MGASIYLREHHFPNDYWKTAAQFSLRNAMKSRQKNLSRQALGNVQNW